MYVLCFKSVNGSIGKGKVMLESYMESLFTPKDGKIKSSDIHKTLTSIINLPSSFTPESWDKWLTSYGGKANIPKPLLKILEGDRSGSRSVEIRKLITEYADSIRVGSFEQALAIKSLKEEIIKAFETTFNAEASRIQRYTLARKNNLLSIAEENTILGTSVMPASKAADQIALMVKRGDSLSNLKSFINRVGAGKDFIVNVIKKLKDDKKEDIAALVGQMDAKIGGSSDYELNQLLKSIETKEKVKVFISTYCRTESIMKLIEMLSSESSFKAKTGLDISILPGILNNRKTSQKIKDLISDQILHNNGFDKVIKETDMRNFILNKQQEFIKKAIDTGKQPSIRVLKEAIISKVQLKLQDRYETLLSGIVDKGLVGAEYYSQLTSMINNHVINELSFINDYVTYPTRKILDKNNNEITINSLHVDNVVYPERLKRFGAPKKTKKQEERESDTEFLKLTALINTLPPEMKVAQNLVKYSIKAKTLQKLQRLKAEGKHLNKNSDDLKESIFNEHGHIVIGSLFKKALEELDAKTSSPYASTVCLRAILFLAKGSGTWRSKHAYLYKQIYEMADKLHAAAKESGVTLDQLLDRRRLEDKDPDENKGRRNDVTRGHRKDPDFSKADYLDRLQIRNLMRAIPKRSKIIGEYAPPYVDSRGKPLSPAIQKLFERYVSNMKTNAVFQKMVVDNPNGIHGLFINYLTSKHGQRLINDEIAFRLKDVDKDPEVSKAILGYERVLYGLRYERIQQSLESSLGHVDKNTGFFIPQKRRNLLSGEANKAVNKTGQFDEAKKQELMEADSSEDYLFGISKVIPPNVQEKFQGYSLLGMIHASESEEELSMVMSHIHTLIPKDHLDTLQENASVKISDVHLEKQTELNKKTETDQQEFLRKQSLARQQEIQGLNNTPDVTRGT
jgi:hypothetical protein